MIYQKRKTNNVLVSRYRVTYGSCWSHGFSEISTRQAQLITKSTQTHIPFHKIIIYIVVTIYNKENIKLFLLSY